MLERRTDEKGNRLVSMPSSDALIDRLEAANLIQSGIPDVPNRVSSTFVSMIEGRQMTPKQIAASWAQAREIVMGGGHSVAKFIVGLHGTSVINALIPKRDLAREAIDHLSSAYSEVSRRS